MIAAPIADPLVGQSVDAYELQERIAAGGMGIVYRAEHRGLQQTHAVKVLPDRFAADPCFVQRFRREATLTAALRHPNIVLIYGCGEQDGLLYLAMQYLPGHSLHDILRSSGPLPMDRAIRLLAQLADALDYAHALGVAHRDVKPANLIVGPTDHLTLVDFGIARTIDGTHVTTSGEVIGTLAYMAPEVLTGSVEGPSADQYALGVVAYEMMTGRVPFNDANRFAMMHAQVYASAPSPRLLRADLAPAVEQALLRQLAKEPSERFPSARSFVDALRAGLMSTPPSGTRPSPSVRPSLVHVTAPAAALRSPIAPVESPHTEPKSIGIRAAFTPTPDPRTGADDAGRLARLGRPAIWGLLLGVVARWLALATLYPMTALFDGMFGVTPKYGHFDLMTAWVVAYLGLTVLAAGGLLAVWCWRRHLGPAVYAIATDAAGPSRPAMYGHTRASIRAPLFLLLTTNLGANQDRFALVTILTAIPVNDSAVMFSEPPAHSLSLISR